MLSGSKTLILTMTRAIPGWSGLLRAAGGKANGIMGFLDGILVYFPEERDGEPRGTHALMANCRLQPETMQSPLEKLMSVSTSSSERRMSVQKMDEAFVGVPDLEV
jgi:hypothetical protein